jgi:NAD(P)-dependent dehydrogenase (short-subunit alcohol dehydrogenase family)
VVTGAGSGIGAAAARRLAAAGAEVMCVDVNVAAVAGVLDEIDALGGRAAGFAADVSSSDEVRAMAAAVQDQGGPVDILFNNAGIAVDGAVHDLAEADWARCLAVNLTGTFLVSKAFLPRMLSRGGAIVNNCSSLATAGSPAFAAYHASKGGVRALTVSMARDYGPGVRVNSVSAGPTETAALRAAIQRHPRPLEIERQLVESAKILRRLACPEEIAAAVVFLASDDASYITGHDLVIDGGQTSVAY